MSKGNDLFNKLKDHVQDLNVEKIEEARIHLLQQHPIIQHFVSKTVVEYPHIPLFLKTAWGHCREQEWLEALETVDRMLSDPRTKDYVHTHLKKQLEYIRKHREELREKFRELLKHLDDYTISCLRTCVKMLGTLHKLFDDFSTKRTLHGLFIEIQKSMDDFMEFSSTAEHVKPKRKLFSFSKKTH